jgi:hypothetical protein
VAHFSSTSLAARSFRFSDQGRHFQVHVVLGEEANYRVRDELLASLSSLVVDRCPPADPPEPVAEFGTLVPEEGRPGDEVTLSGLTGRDENWFWSPLDRIEVWWSRDALGMPSETEGQHLRSCLPARDQTRHPVPGN